MKRDLDDGQALIAAWRTNHRVTSYLIQKLPPELWPKAVPGAPRRTVRTIAAHIHNARCMWIKMLGVRHGIVVPRTVDVRRVRPTELSRALARSCEGIVDLIRLGAERAAHLIGFQVGAASLGIAFLPALAGLLAEQHGLETIPPLLVLSALVMLLLHETIVARAP